MDQIFEDHVNNLAQRTSKLEQDIRSLLDHLEYVKGELTATNLAMHALLQDHPNPAGIWQAIERLQSQLAAARPNPNAINADAFQNTITAIRTSLTRAR